MKQYIAVCLLGLMLWADVPAWAGQTMRLAVFDFTTIDMLGQKFYGFAGDFCRLPEQEEYDALTAADRISIDDTMQGFVKMLEVREEIARRQEERALDREAREEFLDSRRKLAGKIMNSPNRPVVIGAEYFTAALGKYPRFKVVARKNIDAALEKLEDKLVDFDEMEQNFQDFITLSGATHVVYTVVADYGEEEREFSGYNITTRQIIRSLDLIVKVVDLNTREVVFAEVFTGEDKEVLTGNYTKYKSSNRYSKLMKNAIKQAAEAMDEHFDALEQEQEEEAME